MERQRMNGVALGTICGLVFGVLDVLVMIPLAYENRRKRAEAMTAAFIERFMIGFLIPNVGLGVHPVITGLIVGCVLSLPSAIITRAYVPIVGIGTIGGLVIGLVAKVVL
jgi:hypothetical protein